MKPNVIKNLAPILALKTVYIKKVKDVKKQNNIPYINITNKLTTTQPGFRNTHTAEWIIIDLEKIESKVVIVKINDSHTLYFITMNKQLQMLKGSIDTIIKNYGGNSINEYNINYYYPNIIIYDYESNEFPSLEYTFSINVFTAESIWLDFHTLTDDNKNILEVIEAKQYKFPPLHLANNPLLRVIIKSEETIIPKYLSFVMHNRTGGPDTCYREIIH